MTPQAAKRDPDATRQALIEAAFEEIHKVGFRSASLDAILAKTGVTKGALYHHFPNKQALGYAVLDEFLLPQAAEEWKILQDHSIDPIAAMEQLLQDHLDKHSDDAVLAGCPVNNLVQEMSGIDEGFRQRLAMVQERWVKEIDKALQRGIENGQVKTDIDTRQIALLMVAGFEGSASLAKCAQSKSVWSESMNALIEFTRSLRA